MAINPISIQQAQPLGVQNAFAQSPASPARPFVKWVGGKTQLINQLDSNFPTELRLGKVSTYIEPFVGGGAVFFHVAQNYPILRFILADTNSDLIIAFWTIRERVGQLITVLHDLQTDYLKLTEQKREKFYYSVRTQFNAAKSSVDVNSFSDSWIQRTSQLIFLNKTCFNGLFRVNSSGQFNVAFGKYDNPKICDPDNLVQVAHQFRRAEVYLCDFQQLLQFVEPTSFVYIDPPYRPLTETANFTGYSANTFTALDQQRLARFCHDIDAIGAHLLISNSDPSNVDPEDNFFQQTYPTFKFVQTAANRMINCHADKRGKINELLIMNY